MNKRKAIIISIFTFFVSLSVVNAGTIFDDVCKDEGILISLRTVGFIILAIKILVPIIIILMGTVDLTRAIISNDENQIKDRSIIFIKRIVMGVLIFFIPTMISIVFSLLTNYNVIKNTYKTCIECIESPLTCVVIKTTTNTSTLVITKSYQLPSGSAKVSTPDLTGGPGVTKYVATSDKYPDSHKAEGIFGSFPYRKLKGRDIEIDPKWVSENIINVKVPCKHLSFNTVTVHKLAQKYFVAALENICTLTSKGFNGIKLNPKDVNYGGSFVQRNTSSNKASKHAWGIAIDFNYNWKTTVGKKTYTPYSWQGPSTKRDYDKFVNAIGGESNIKNVNYILWKYAFEPAGFEWGGNWRTSSFDPMHYELNS